MQIEQISPKKLKPWEKNPRINDHAVEAVSKSIAEFGFNSPILCDENYRILAGHTRWKAAKKMGLETVPVIALTLSETQKNAFSIADNKTAEIATWDLPELSSILEDLKIEEFNLDVLGFDESQLDALLVPPVEIDWSELEESMLFNTDAAHIRLLVKIPVEEKETIKRAIKGIASKYQYSHADQGILAGLVLKKLLETCQMEIDNG